MKTFREQLAEIVALRKKRFGTPEALTRARLILMVDVNPDNLTPELDRDPGMIERLRRAAAELGIQVG